MPGRAQPLILLAAIGMIAGAGALWALSRGVGISPDSIQYLHYARVLMGQEKLVTEDGLSIAVTHYPPLYPTIIAALAMARINLLHAPQYLNVACFALSALLAAAIVLRSGGGRFRAAAAAAALAAQPAFFSVHLWALSEPPFLVLLLVIVGLLGEYRSGRIVGKKIATAIGLCLGAAVLTRYVGLSLVPAAVALVWFSRRNGLLSPDRRRDTVAIGIAAAAPMVALAIVQRLMGGSVAHRSVEYHAITAARWRSLLQTVADWLASPDMLGAAAVPVAILCAVVLAAVIIRGGRRSGIGPIALVVGGAYLPFLIISIALFDNATPLDDRMLSPLAVLLTLWLATDLPSPLSKDQRFAPAGAMAAAAAVLVSVSAIARDAPAVRSLRDTGLGFNHVRYRSSPLVKACRDLPKKTVIYSNFPEALWLHCDRDARILPGHPTELGRELTPMPQQMALVADRLHDGGYVAYFNFHQSKRPTIVIISIDELEAVVPLRKIMRTSDGTLYRTAKSAVVR